MPRKPGSKGKKTLARELGIDLDTYIRLEKEGKLEEFRSEVLGVQTKIEEENREGNVEIIVVSNEDKTDEDKVDESTDTKASEDKNKIEENKNKIVKPRKSKTENNKSKDNKIIDPELDVVENKVEIKTENKIEDKLEDTKTEDKPLNTVPTSSTKPIITPKTKVMIPGSERDESEIQNDNRVVEKNKNKSGTVNKSVSSSRNSILCSRCHKAILKDSSHRIKLENLVPGIAEYRYNLKDDIWLCHDCAVGLSKWIEDFLDNEGEGCERKFGVEMSGEIED